MKNIAVVDFGMGNIHSMVKALRLYAPETLFTSDAEALRRADALVLPGDGAFAAAMEQLEMRGLVGVIKEHVAAGKPLLGVCIGFQILFADSDESDGSRPGSETMAGLALIPGAIRRFRFDDSSVRIPHMGWNRLEPSAAYAASRQAAGAESPEWSQSYMYFIHSYRAESVAEESVVSWCDYGGDRFAALVAHGSILATQFHPEKSDRAGLDLIGDWVASL